MVLKVFRNTRHTVKFGIRGLILSFHLRPVNPVCILSFSLRSVLIFSFHVRPGLPSVLCPLVDHRNIACRSVKIMKLFSTLLSVQLVLKQKYIIFAQVCGCTSERQWIGRYCGAFVRYEDKGNGRTSSLCLCRSVRYKEEWLMQDNILFFMVAVYLQNPVQESLAVTFVSHLLHNVPLSFYF
jgi:hypothetical protein